MEVVSCIAKCRLVFLTAVFRKLFIFVSTQAGVSSTDSKQKGISHLKLNDTTVKKSYRLILTGKGVDLSLLIWIGKLQVLKSC